MCKEGPGRRELEEFWRRRVQEAYHRYKDAAETVRRCQLKYAGQIPYEDGNFAMRQAQQHELTALKEYRRVLTIFGDLLTQGQIPPAEPPQS
ncbi:MAG TPA: hypothetical protein VMH28_34555 [Candidatus Acidoferrales bacterium]|nr:hypothetical protein [Candidatus Acidoferrales bacterium]